MSEARFYCENLTPGVVELEAGESRHALQVLRLRLGDEIILFDGRGRLAHGVLQPNEPAAAGKARRPGGKGARVARVVVERILCEPPPITTLTLIVAASKGARLTWMLEKLTELGTTHIVIAEFERSVVHVGEGHEAKLRRTALEAGKQSQRAWLPEISCGLALVDAVPGSPDGRLLVAHPSPEAPTLASQLHGQVRPDNRYTAVVGPEGGLTDAEMELLLDRGGGLVRLAPHILRVETAAVAVAANWAAHLPG